MTKLASKTKATRTVKPKCNATPCGFTCISAKYVCSSRILKRDADALVNSVAKQDRATNGSHDDFKHNTSYDEELHNWDYEGYKVSRNIEFDEQADAVSKATGLSKQQSLDGINALYFGYTGGDYDTIRKYDADVNSVEESKRAELSKTVSDVAIIAKALPVYSGKMSRGLKFNTELERTSFLDSIKDGMSLNAMTSFTSRDDLANRFAGGTAVGVGVVLTVSNNKSGASVKPFSKVKDEDEILVLKGAKYAVKGIAKSSSLYSVELEEL